MEIKHHSFHGGQTGREVPTAIVFDLPGRGGPVDFIEEAARLYDLLYSTLPYKTFTALREKFHEGQRQQRRN